ncbi:putative metalloprotease CJM1_0395 family protein [Sulfurimonas sp.]
MNVGLNTLYDIGSNYAVKLNEKEMLVYEEDETLKSKNPHAKKLKEDEEKKADEAKKEESSDELSDDEERLVKDLQARDSEVKAHEAAHQAAGGGMTGAASYTYQQGPDGKMYAIGGEVSISVSGGSTPQETIANARQVAAAAMAPGNPSPQDYSVASSARVMEMKAQQQLAKQQQEEVLGKETYGSKENNIKNYNQPLDISA